MGAVRVRHALHVEAVERGKIVDAVRLCTWSWETRAFACGCLPSTSDHACAVHSGCLLNQGVWVDCSIRRSKDQKGKKKRKKGLPLNRPGPITSAEMCLGHGFCPWGPGTLGLWYEVWVCDGKTVHSGPGSKRGWSQSGVKPYCPLHITVTGSPPTGPTSERLGCSICWTHFIRSLEVSRTLGEA